MGALVPSLTQPILIVAEAGREEEVVTRLARIGYDNSLGYLKGGIASWKAAGNDLDTLQEISANDFALETEKPKDINLLDARRESEYKSEHLADAENFPLDFINRNMAWLDPHKKYYIHCAGGYRSLIAASILKSRGFDKVINIKGGYKALSETNLKRTDHVEVNTEL